MPVLMPIFLRVASVKIGALSGFELDAKANTLGA